MRMYCCILCAIVRLSHMLWLTFVNEGLIFPLSRQGVAGLDLIFAADERHRERGVRTVDCTRAIYTLGCG